LRSADRGLRNSATWRAFWITLFAIGAIAVLAFGWQGGEPFTAAAFVVFFTSRVARAIVKRPLTPRADRDPVAHANQFLIVTAAGWFGAGALAAAAALTGEGGEWLYVVPFFLLMGALQIFVLRWTASASSHERDAHPKRNAGRLALAGAGVVAIGVGAIAFRAMRDRPAPTERIANAQPLKYELVTSRSTSGDASLRIRNLDRFAWTRVRVFIGQGDEHAYVCETSPSVPANAVLIVDVARCLSDEGLTADLTRAVTTFGLRAVEGSIDSRRQ
jgi:hypothetical protein